MRRSYWNRKATADESCRLTMPNLKKQGMLAGWVTGKIIWKYSMTDRESAIGLTVDATSDNPYAWLFYNATDGNGQRDYDYTVSLVATPCYFGGIRWWFTCPSCGRRVGVLYLAPGEVYFQCRHCQNLSYHSRNCCMLGKFGKTSREIDRLRGEIRRWTWRGLPTRKIERLQVLERKMEIVSASILKKWEKC